MDSQSGILTPEDKLLMRYAGSGSQAAFAELVERYYDFVYSVCLRQLGDTQLAQDTSQTVFLLLATKADGLKGGAVLTSWLFKTAHFACRNIQRTEIRRRRYEEQAAREMQLEQTLGNPEPAWREIEPLLDDALARLSERDREVVLLRYVDGLSLAEIASAFGITLTTAHKRITRALEKMRRHIERAGASANGATFTALLDKKLVLAAPAGASHQASLLFTPSGAAAAGNMAIYAGYKAVLKEMALVKVKLALIITLTVCVIAAAGSLLSKLSRPSALAMGSYNMLPTLATALTVGKMTVLSGRILDKTGEPVGGASVTVVRYYGQYDLPPIAAASVTTDQGGNYSVRLALLPHDVCTVFADSEDSFGWGEPGKDIRLPKPATVWVRVVDGGGKPVAGVSVEPLQFEWVAGGRFLAIQPGPACPKRLIVTTDARGTALMRGLPAGYGIGWQIDDPTYAPAPNDPVPGSSVRVVGDMPEVTLRVARAGAIQGTVLTDDGRAAPAGLRVGAQLLGQMQSISAYTDENGRYVIAHAPPGVYNVAVDNDSPILGGEWSAIAVPGVSIETGRMLTDRNITLTRGVVISGRVIHRSTGMPDVGIQVGIYGPAHPQSSPWVQDAYTDSHGVFTARVPPGKQYVYIMTDADAAHGQNVMTGTPGASAIRLEAEQ